MSAFACTMPEFSVRVTNLGAFGSESEEVFRSADPDDTYEVFLNTAAFVGQGIDGAFYFADDVAISCVVYG